jgi:hypothetical protein
MSSKRLFFWIRVSGTALLVVYSLWGPIAGLYQQVKGLQPESIDCEYRVTILRDRLLNAMERPRFRERSSETFAHLLRETHAACADTKPELIPKLETLSQIHDEHRDWRLRSAAARAELRAL